MCVLICRVGDRPLIGANRDEFYNRPFSGPRRWEGDVAFTAPLDETEGGTWIGRNDAGMVAAITNLSRLDTKEGRASRGHLVAGALSQPDVESARAFLDHELAQAERNPCQILLLQAGRAVVCVNEGDRYFFEELAPGTHVLSNLHDTDEVVFDLPADFTLDDLRPILADTRKNLPRDFAVCKYTGNRGTVSSSLIDPVSGEYWYAGGAPDQTPYERQPLPPQPS
ncbi:MAG: NRDE family protein [Planctomycetota bacterium]